LFVIFYHIEIPCNFIRSLVPTLERGNERNIFCGYLSEPICEVELELKRGNIANIYEIASKLQTAISLIPENKSKAARGYQLYNTWQSL
jgi:inorganic triphosphatase YgiF